LDPYKYICKYIVVPLWARYEQSSYLSHVQYLEKSQYYSVEKIKDIQWRQIKELLIHAYENTTFYREHFNSKGIHPIDIRDTRDFEKIPILTKEYVRNQQDILYANNYDKYIHFKTSGSTGIPIEGFRNKSCNDFKRACNLRSNMWSGYELGERIYCIYGNPKNKYNLRTELRRILLTREAYLNSLDLHEESMSKFAATLQKYPPSLLWGHAHNVYIFANYLEKKGIRNIRPKGMYSAGMVLHDWERKKVEKVFDCKFQDRYGCEELGLIATECKAQQGLHINVDNLYVEFVDDAGIPVPAGVPGRIVVTDLSNYVMPFIRYDMGDVGILSKNKCSCGRTQPLIEKIVGRIADFLITPKGKMISGISLTDHFGANIPGVNQIQIVQDDIDKIRINIVKSNTYDENSENIVGELVNVYFGPEMRHVCQYMDKILPDKSGKYRFTICNIKNNFMD
jgi:phenylacetate-CoA ligase